MKNVSMKQVQQMLAGSQRLNEMKAEIDGVVRIVLGLLTKEETRRFGFRQVIVEFNTPNLRWKVTKLKGDTVEVSAYPEDEGAIDHIYSSHFWGANNIKMEDVQSVYTGLPQVINSLAQVFPSLTDRFAPLLKVAQ